MTIRVLPDLLINQIAAGEVVEDPLSVVKELIENALDAGAQTIDIELVAGGQRLIRVCDNGCGMGKDDAILCFERHATSKIRVSEDLESLTTMGFRGEALAAIAGVSKVSLRTSTQNGSGTFVEIYGGKLLKVEPCSRSSGTTIEIRDLFFNVPARKKFQKSGPASGAKIERWLSLFSLGYPEVTFSLRELEKILHLPKQETGLLGRVRDVYGEEFASKQLAIEEQKEDIRLHGFISPVDMHRPQRSGQVIFINRRLVQAPLIGYAIREAYATSLPEGRHPLFVLHLQLSSDQVDVNVHPQKKEVRFRDEEGIKKFIRSTIFKTFVRPCGPEEPFSPIYADFKSSERLPWTFQETVLPKNDQVPIHLPETKPKTVALLGRYLLVETHDRMPFQEKIVVVDLQRALERIMEEHRGSSQPLLASQMLLVPIRIELNKQEAEELRKRKEGLETIGMTLTEIAERLFCIERIPAGWDSERVENVLLDFLVKDKEESFSAIPFHRCVKKTFLLQEAEEILQALLKTEEPHRSPLGQSTMVPLSENDLGRLF